MSSVVGSSTDVGSTCSTDSASMAMADGDRVCVFTNDRFFSD